MPAVGWILLNVLSLALATGYAVAAGAECRWSWLLVLFAFLPGNWGADEFGAALFRWFGLGLLLLAVGPVIQNPAARALRSAAWQIMIQGLAGLTALFVVWYGLHLPSIGSRAYFTGFMNQSMLLGPVVGLGVVIALTRALHARSWRWALLSILGLAPLLASGSRLAALATGGAACFLLLRRKPILGGVMALLFGLAVYSFVTQGGESPAVANDSPVGALYSKGVGNSRATLWENRISDFTANPLFGVGIAVGSRGSGDYEQSLVAGVEPGSSYLAVLSMTGSVGFVTFFSALGLILFKFVRSHQSAAVEKDLVSVVGVFLAVHAVAEGWVLGFGSPIGFLFWLWTGRVGDAGQPRVQMKASLGRRRLGRSAPTQISV